MRIFRAALLLVLAASSLRAQSNAGLTAGFPLFARQLQRATRAQHKWSCSHPSRRCGLQVIANDLKPSLSIDGMAQYQSDVPEIGANLPGISLPTAPHDTYDARVNAQQRSSIIDSCASGQ